MAKTQPPPKDDHRLEAKLRRLHFDGPSAALRDRTLRSTREAMAAANHNAPRVLWTWKPVSIAAALLLCASTLPQLFSTSTPQPKATHQPAPVALWLDLEEDLARHVSPSLSGSRGSSSPRSNSRNKGSQSHGRYDLDPTRL